MNNIAVIFGTFNPLTMAHIQIGLLAQKKVNAQKVIYVIAQDSFLQNWKQMDNDSIIPADFRFKLMKQALNDYGFIASDIELTGKSDGKTYNSINYLKTIYPSYNFYIVMGTDKVGELDKWYKSEQLISENKFLIIDRDNNKLEDVIVSSPLASKYQDNFISITNDKFNFVSSTIIRQAYVDNTLEQYKQYLPKNIYQYLSQNKSILKKGNANMTNLHSFVKAATASFTLRLGDVQYNKEQVLSLVSKAVKSNVELVVFPELTLTGYSCSDMFLTSQLASDSLNALIELAEKISEIEGDVAPVVVVGLPYRHNFKLYNCAAY